MKVFVSFDGDHIGRMVGRASLADHPEEVAKISQAIDRGNEIWRSWVLSHGGKVISIGGDEGRLEVEADHLTELPKIREQYQTVVGSTVSVGVGTKLSEADKSLMAAKLQGGDRIQLYTETVNELLEELQDKPEGEKLFEEYLDPDTALQKAQPGMNPGANAGFSGASRSQPAAPRSEASEHSEAEAARAVYNQAPNQQAPAPTNYEELFHQIAAQTPEDQAQKPSGLQDGVRAQIVQVLQDVRAKADKLEEIRTTNPDLYNSVKGLVQAMIAMAQSADGGQEPVQKAEGKVGQCKWKLGERRCQRQVTGDYCHDHKDHWANKIRQRSEEIKKALPPHEIGQVTSDGLQEQGFAVDNPPHGMPVPGDGNSVRLAPSQRRVRRGGDVSTQPWSTSTHTHTIVFDHPEHPGEYQHEQRYIVNASTFAQAAHAARIHFLNRFPHLDPSTQIDPKMGVPTPNREAAKGIEVDEAQGHESISSDAPGGGRIFAMGHEGAPIDRSIEGGVSEPWWTRQPDGSVTRPDGRVYWDLREPNTDDLPINKSDDLTKGQIADEADYLWGASHGNSKNIALASANLMGIKKPHWTPQPGWDPADRQIQDIARSYLANIHNHRSPEPLYHGFENVQKLRHKIGDIVHLPLTSSAGTPDTVSYGIRLDTDYQRGEPTLYTFPAGIPYHPYSIRRKGIDENHEDWTPEQVSEGLVAGRFRVKHVETRQYHGWQHDRRNGKSTQPKYKVVHLEPTEYFHPDRGWFPAGQQVNMPHPSKAGKPPPSKVGKSEDLMPGGKGDSKPDSDFDADQLATGVKREMEEHGLDEARAKEVAKDHLSEDPKYYSIEKALSVGSVAPRPGERDEDLLAPHHVLWDQLQEAGWHYYPDDDARERGTPPHTMRLLNPAVYDRDGRGLTGVAQEVNHRGPIHRLPHGTIMALITHGPASKDWNGKPSFYNYQLANADPEGLSYTTRSHADVNADHETLIATDKLGKAALQATKTGRHQVVLPVGSRIDSGPAADHEAGKIKVRNPEDGKSKWRSVRAGIVMAPDGTPTSSRNPGG